MKCQHKGRRFYFSVFAKNSVYRLSVRPRLRGGVSVPEESAAVGSQPAPVRALQAPAARHQKPSSAPQSHQHHSAGGTQCCHGNLPVVVVICAIPMSPSPLTAPLQKAQLGVQDEEIRSLKSSLGEEQRRNADLQQEMRMQTDRLQAQVQQQLQRQQEEQRENHRLQVPAPTCLCMASTNPVFTSTCAGLVFSGGASGESEQAQEPGGGASER